MKFKIKKIIKIIALIGFSCAILGGATSLVFASGATGTWDDNSYIPLARLPGVANGGGTITIDTYIPGVFNLTIGMAGVLAVIMIIIGGVEYMTTDAIEGKSDGKKIIGDALKGLLLVLVSWILVYTINPNLTVFDLSAKPIIVDTEGTGEIFTNKEKSASSINDQGYTVNKQATITTYEDGAQSYAVTEFYTDKETNAHLTRTTKDKSGVYSTKIYINDVLMSENADNPNYNFDNWNEN